MRSSIESELRKIEARLRLDLTAELDRRMLELKRDVDGELEAIQQRIDGVHKRALKALTDQTERGAP